MESGGFETHDQPEPGRPSYPAHNGNYGGRAGSRPPQVERSAPGSPAPSEGAYPSPPPFPLNLPETVIPWPEAAVAWPTGPDRPTAHEDHGPFAAPEPPSPMAQPEDPPPAARAPMPWEPGWRETAPSPAAPHPDPLAEAGPFPGATPFPGAAPFPEGSAFPGAAPFPGLPPFPEAVPFPGTYPEVRAIPENDFAIRLPEAPEAGAPDFPFDVPDAPPDVPHPPLTHPEAFPHSPWGTAPQAPPPAGDLEELLKRSVMQSLGGRADVPRTRDDLLRITRQRLEEGYVHFSRSGERLTTPEAVVDAFLRDGSVIVGSEVGLPPGFRKEVH